MKNIQEKNARIVKEKEKLHIIYIEKCENCEGTGGTICMKCKGSSYKIVNLYQYDSCMRKDCSCDNGYEDKCYECKGKKSIIIGTNSKDCNKCILYED